MIKIHKFPSMKFIWKRSSYQYVQISCCSQGYALVIYLLYVKTYLICLCMTLDVDGWLSLNNRKSAWDNASTWTTMLGWRRLERHPNSLDGNISKSLTGCCRQLAVTMPYRRLWLTNLKKTGISFIFLQKMMARYLSITGKVSFHWSHLI